MIRVENWVRFVADLETDEHENGDIFEIDISLANRHRLEEILEQLSSEDRKAVRQADERYRMIGLDALTRCGLLKGYRWLGEGTPPEKWWWHL